MLPQQTSGLSAPPPGPTGVGKCAALAHLLRDPWFYPLELTKKFGDVVTVPAPFAKVVYISHPDHIDHILVKHADRYRRSDMVAAQMVPPELGHNFFAFADDAEWQRGRSLYRPSFTHKNLGALGDLFTQSISEQVGSWADAAGHDGVVDIEEKTRELALAALFNAMFDEYLSPRLLGLSSSIAIPVMLATTVRVAMSSLPGWVPRPFQRKAAALLNAGLAAADHVIETRRRHPTGRADILSLLVGATYDDGTPLENEKIATEMMGMVVGGHETTAAALAWTFALLAQHPDIEERVVAEVDALGSGRVTFDDMSKLPFVRACFDEAQRMQGGLVINPKTAVVDDEIGGYHIASGTTVLYSSLAMQHDPRFWSEPHRFNPDRFKDTANNDVRAFVPFGRGQRMCLGKNMAYIEGVLTIATAYRRYRLTLEPGYRLRRQYRMSMGLKGGLPMTVVPR